MGWIFSIIVLFGGIIINEISFTTTINGGDRLLLLSPNVSDHKDGLLNIFYSTTPKDIFLNLVGWFIWVAEFACWFMFYWSKGDAIKYARYIIASNAATSTDATNPL